MSNRRCGTAKSWPEDSKVQPEPPKGFSLPTVLIVVAWLGLLAILAAFFARLD
jgi:hypothetical protein